MAQNVNLSVSGIYTAPSDLNGIPPGALDVAVNVESRHKNTLEPRRGFSAVTNSEIVAQQIRRIVNFYVNGGNSRIGLFDDGILYYYNGAGWTQMSGLATLNTQY